MSENTPDNLEAPEVYVVKKGDTLTKIAFMHNKR